MSGIVGIYYRDGRPLEGSELNGPLDAISHRGRDASGIWAGPSEGLGHRMAWTTPQSLHEKLPISDPRGRLALAYDGRVDNRQELALAFGLAGSAAEELTDGELILKTYEKWGEECVERLVGDFVFAVWDEARQEIFLARDPLGVKPVYYHLSDRLFAFASEIKALLSLPEVPRLLDEVRVGDYLAPLVDDKAITFYRGVLRLPPGHCIRVGRGEARLKRYWTLEPEGELHLGSDEEYDSAFRELFTEAVRCRLRSAYPAGTALTGGLNSSSVACVARDLLRAEGGEPLRAVVALFDDAAQTDDSRSIQQLLAQGGFEPHYLETEGLSPLRDFERVTRHLEEPFFAPNLFLDRSIYEACRGRGARVLLSGSGALATVPSGFQRLSELALGGRWISLLSESRKLAEAQGLSPRRVLWRYGLSPLAPHSLRPAWRALRGKTILGPRVNPTIRREFAGRIGLEDRAKAFKEFWTFPPRTTQEEHRRRLVSGLGTFYLEVSDKLAAMSQIELRFPFLDKRLVEFCFALPSAQKLSAGWDRIILRRALQGIIPEEIAWRRGSSNLLGYVIRGLTTTDRALLESEMFKESGELSEYVDLKALQGFYRQYLAGEKSADVFCMIWRAVSLGLWLRQTGLSP